MHPTRHRIGVLHPGFHTRGGAEAVALHFIEALESSYEVTLFTTISPDFDSLNNYYGTNVSSVDVIVPSVLRQIPLEVRRDYAGVFLYAVLVRVVKSLAADSLDALVSTFNEIGGIDGLPTVQYIHCPLYNRKKHPAPLRPDGFIQQAYSGTCARIAGISDQTMALGTVLTNSDWMGTVVERIYDVSTNTVYPPVDTTPFVEAKEKSTCSDFVTVGRQTPDKNILQSIEIIQRVRDQGHSVGLTIVGPSGDPEYAATVEKRASESSFVEFVGEVDRTELVDIISRHRYGLHGKEYEHFGIVVAEMVAANTLPFVPRSGGQQEIVNNQNLLTYNSVSDAVDKINKVLSDEQLEEQTRHNLPDTTAKYGRKRFKRRVSHILDGTVGGVP